jgi:alkylhydroperoxidase/carboxymuconolactone decarboxylase family protein YurZ
MQPDDERTLRRLALNDDFLLASVLASYEANLETSNLDPGTHALIRLGALLALDVTPTSLASCVQEALAAGVTPTQIVGALIAVTPAIGSARAVTRVRTLALELGYDVDAALEVLE